jgi:hypothetical protein
MIEEASNERMKRDLRVIKYVKKQLPIFRSVRNAYNWAPFHRRLVGRERHGKHVCEHGGILCQNVTIDTKLSEFRLEDYVAIRHPDFRANWCGIRVVWGRVCGSLSFSRRGV